MGSTTARIGTLGEGTHRLQLSGRRRASCFTKLADSIGGATEIAARPETAQGFVPLKQRWVVERSFAWTNRRATPFFRRIVKDYEYTKESSEAKLLLANTTVVLNKLAA